MLDLLIFLIQFQVVMKLMLKQVQYLDLTKYLLVEKVVLEVGMIEMMVEKVVRSVEMIVMMVGKIVMKVEKMPPHEAGRPRQALPRLGSKAGAVVIGLVVDAIVVPAKGFDGFRIRFGHGAPPFIPSMAP